MRWGFDSSIRSRMAWVKVPPENHPIFRAALPQDPRVETMQMFGGVAAKVNGHVFAGLFGRSTMLWLPPPERAEALALEGAAMFDPMGNGRVRSDKVMLPEAMMGDPAELRRWIGRAFKAAASLPAKANKMARPRTSSEMRSAQTRPTAKRAAVKAASKKRAMR
jgi:hypothetical protein